MELIVSCRGREEKVTLERDGEIARITVGATSYVVDVAMSGSGLRSLLIDGRQVEVHTQRERDGRYRVSGLGMAADELVAVEDPLTHLARQATASAGRRRTEQVTAYMPGKVVAVLLAVGDSVHAGQGVVVLEAMKMQNEIQAPHDGVIKTMHVVAGQPVEGGDPLFDLA